MRVVIFFLIGFGCHAQEIPLEAQKIIKAYPEKIIGYKDNKILFKDGSALLFDDKNKKSNGELLTIPDIQDQFIYRYKETKPSQNHDPGRIRNEDFFKQMYGKSEAEVRKNLIDVVWCPKLVNKKIKITSVNGIDKIVKKLSAELDQHPEFQKYIINIGGTFNWRKISGTNRLSTHSFGMTIDINVKYSNYWQWDCNCKNEDAKLSIKNRIPKKLVQIFEKHGFIWGGNWYHYDTMHFEYRPELLN